MRVISTNCPNCGNVIDLDLEHIQRFCGRCGSKLLLDVEDIARIVQAQEATKREKMRLEAEERMHYADIQAEERKRAEERRQQEINEARYNSASSGDGCAVVAFLLFWGFIMLLIILPFP